MQFMIDILLLAWVIFVEAIGFILRNLPKAIVTIVILRRELRESIEEELSEIAKAQIEEELTRKIRRIKATKQFQKILEQRDVS